MLPLLWTAKVVGLPVLAPPESVLGLITIDTHDTGRPLGRCPNGQFTPAWQPHWTLLQSAHSRHVVLPSDHPFTCFTSIGLDIENNREHNALSFMSSIYPARLQCEALYLEYQCDSPAMSCVTAYKSHWMKKKKEHCNVAQSAAAFIVYFSGSGTVWMGPKCAD